jgi:predicted XRE-type DNA-binding protein
MSTTDDTTITPSSGNVYADLGLPNPEERRTKADLARQIDAILTGRKLTQRAAAAILGIPQPKVSNILNGRLSGFSVERLMGLLAILGQDVQIVLTPAADAKGRGEITVAVRSGPGDRAAASMVASGQRS